MVVVIAAGLRGNVPGPAAEARSEAVLAAAVKPGLDVEYDRQAPVADPPRNIRLSVAVSGDILAHLPVVQRARALAGARGGYDFAPMLKPLRRLVGGSHLALCHLETPLQTGPPTG